MWYFKIFRSCKLILIFKNIFIKEILISLRALLSFLFCLQCYISTIKISDSVPYNQRNVWQACDKHIGPVNEPWSRHVCGLLLPLTVFAFTSYQTHFFFFLQVNMFSFLACQPLFTFLWEEVIEKLMNGATVSSRPGHYQDRKYVYFWSK